MSDAREEERHEEGASGLAGFRFGEIAVWGGLVSKEALDEALDEALSDATLRSSPLRSTRQAERRSSAPGRPRPGIHSGAGGEGVPRIGELLRERELLTEDQVQRVLRVQLQRMPAEGHLLFGRLAVARGFTTEDAVTRALDEQSREMLACGGTPEGGKVRRLGEVLVAAGEMRPEDVEAILAYQATADSVPMSEARKNATGTSGPAPARVGRGPESDAPGPPDGDPDAAGECPSRAPGADEAGRDGPAFLPRGAWGFVLDNAIWIVAGAAVVLAVVLGAFREAIFG